MLIDAGNNGDAQTIKSYLDGQGVKELQYFIGTHAHEDHIGAADYIINSFKVGKVYFPKQTSTTQTFKDFVTAVINNGLSLTVPNAGDTFKLGDAESVSEMEMLNKGLDLKADVLKVGHHGSNTSTSSNFLSAVSPKYAVISVGKDNLYGHPAQETIDRIKNAGAAVFRTDENGTVVMTSNGKEITLGTDASKVIGDFVIRLYHSQSAC